MACPQCGGSDRHLIAPGYWERDSLITVRSVRPAVGSVSDVIPHVETQRCGHRYHEGMGSTSDAPVCACGTFAVGRCMRCGNGVCGDHSSLGTDQKRYCGACLAAIAREKAAAEQARKDEEAARLAAMPSMGPEQIVQYLRGEIDDGDGYVLRPVAGRQLAQVLTQMGIPQVQQFRRGLLGRRVLDDSYWVIWGKRERRNTNPHDTSEIHVPYCLRDDGTVTYLSQVFPADFLWSPEVLRQIRAWLKKFGSDRALDLASRTTLGNWFVWQPILVGA